MPRGHTQGCRSGFSPSSPQDLKPSFPQHLRDQRKREKTQKPGQSLSFGTPTACPRAVGGDLAAARISSPYFYDDTFHPGKAIPPPRQPSAPSGKGNAVPAPGPGAWLRSWSRFPITSCVVSPPRSELTPPRSSHGNCRPRGPLQADFLI